MKAWTYPSPDAFVAAKHDDPGAALEMLSLGQQVDGSVAGQIPIEDDQIRMRGPQQRPQACRFRYCANHEQAGLGVKVQLECEP